MNNQIIFVLVRASVNFRRCRGTFLTGKTKDLTVKIEMVNLCKNRVIIRDVNVLTLYFSYSILFMLAKIAISLTLHEYKLHFAKVQAWR